MARVPRHDALKQFGLAGAGAFVAGDYRTGESMRLLMTWSDRERRLSLRLAPGPRRFLVRVAGAQATREIVFQGRPMEVRL